MANSDIDHFILFIDDLHKHPKLAANAFEFIAGLQIFRSYMYENNINLTIFVSGDLEWIIDVDGIKAIGGSIDQKRPYFAKRDRNCAHAIDFL